MREILFRGRAYSKNGWVYGVPFFEEDRCYMIDDLFICDKYNCTGAVNVSVEPETVGQYTGLTDKNGKRIFEGDIVRLIEWCPSCHDTEIVKFKDGGFAPFSIAGWECTPKWEECEVIGTIHDNPELLEEA